MPMQITRRSALMGALAAGSLPFFTRVGFAESGTLTVATFGGPFGEAQTAAMFKPFEAARPGLKVGVDPGVSDTKLKTMVDMNAVSWDVVVMSPTMGFETDAQWLEPIDYAILNKDDFLPGYAQTYRVGVAIEGTVMAYREDLVGKPTQGFKSLFDLENFPGKRALYRYPSSGFIEAALIADGVDPKALYPLDIDRAFAKLDTIKSEIIWYESGAETVQLMNSGEAPLGLIWLSSATAIAAASKLKLDWTNWIVDGGWWGVPKGTPNKDLAMQAIKFFTDPAQQIAFTQHLPYAPTNKKAVDGANRKFADFYTTGHLNNAVDVDYQWWNQNIAAIEERFQAWLLA